MRPMCASGVLLRSTLRRPLGTRKEATASAGENSVTVVFEPIEFEQAPVALVAHGAEAEARFGHGIGDATGIAGGYLVAVNSLHFNGAIYLRNTFQFMEPQDVALGLVKAAVFGFIIATMGAYQGYNSQGGALGVGRATTNAVVGSIVLILAVNYLITALFVE